MSHACHDHRSDAFRRGLLDIEVGRRRLLQAGAAGVAISAVVDPLTAQAAPQSTPKRVYVVVLDGTRPEELDLGLTPTITGLRAAGRHFPRAQALPIMETIPNHVMMMTGVRPERSGVPANSIFDGTEIRDMDRESDILVPTVIEQLNAAGLTTGTVLSKEYLYGVFGNRATYRWEPFPVIPITGHAPDVSTMTAAISMMRRQDPHLMFVNLGDIDRVGHADLTTLLTGLLTGGDSLPALRRLTLAATDAQVKRLVDAIKAEGHWDDALMVFVADHSMDWSDLAKVVSLTGVVDDIAPGQVEIAQNGGADLLYWTGPAGERSAALARIKEAVLATPGVLAVHTPEELHLGPNAGDVIAYAKAGWRFSDPNVAANPIPGNHGHPATRPIPFFLAGGAVSAGVSSAAVTTMDVAPTVASYLGIGAPSTGWQGASRW